MSVEGTIISMIIETSWYLDMNDDLHETILNINNDNNIPTMSYFTKNTGNGLDEKQTAAYEIICSSVILKSIEKYNLLNSDTVEKNKAFL